jgi:hypothetical protein
MSADRRTKTKAQSDEEIRELKAHQEAVEDALHQADYVRRFIEYVSLRSPHELRGETLFLACRHDAALTGAGFGVVRIKGII